MLLDPPDLGRGRHYPFVVVSDSALSFKPSEYSRKPGKQIPEKLEEVCNFFSVETNVQTHVGQGRSTSTWDDNAPGYGNFRGQN
eukprot:9486114-Alexandrium_andersonii.AAC.1